MAPREQVLGVLLCRVAEHRIAFPAAQVVAVEAWAENGSFPHARLAFQLAAGKGRVLISASGDAVAVDAIEVHTEALSLLPAPPILMGGLGGSLEGFVTAKEHLWPLLKLAEFSRFLSSGAKA